MKKALIIVAIAGFAGLSSADVVANWNFNDQGLAGGGFGFTTSDFPQNADVGTGAFSVGNFNSDDTGGVYNWIQSFAGTTTLAIGGAASGGSFAFQGAAGQGVTNNGAQAIVSFDGSSWSGLSIDFARRGTSTGFSSLTIELFDGGTLIDTVALILGAQSSSWTSNSYAMSALDGVTNASVVFTFDGATSDTGNNRLDNITVNGVPSPSAMALLGLGGLVAGRRRRA